MSRRQVLASFEARLPRLLAHALEHACFSRALASRASYARTSLRCLSLLDRGLLSREELQEKGVLRACCAPLEVFVGNPEKQQELLERNAKRKHGEALLKNLIQGDSTEALPDSGLRCKKCQSNDITLEFLQTRSADEGTTIFCTCTRCQKRWKM